MKVILQNQHGAGKISKKWDRTGLVIDDLGHNKYRIKVDGSGRVTDRNRQFLRQFTPHTPVQSGPHPGNYFHPEPVDEPAPQVDLPLPPVLNPEPVAEPMPRTPVRPEPPAVMPQTPETPGSPSFATPPSTPITNILPRLSTRVSRPPDRFGYDKF